MSSEYYVTQREMVSETKKQICYQYKATGEFDARRAFANMVRDNLSQNTYTSITLSEKFGNQTRVLAIFQIR